MAFLGRCLMSQIVQDAHKTAQYYLDIFALLTYILCSVICAAIQSNYSSSQDEFFILNQSLGRLLSNGYYLSFSLIYIALWLFIRFRFKSVFFTKLKDLNKIEEWSHLNETKEIESSHSLENPISQAINNLQNQLYDVSSNEIKFDQMIREGALLDRETGIGNRDFFNSRLEALLKEEDVHGGVLFLQFKGYDALEVQYSHEKIIQLLHVYIAFIKQKFEKVPSYFIARRNEDEIAILLPRIMVPDLKKMVQGLMIGILKVPTPLGIDTDELIHIGVSYFHGRQTAYQIKSEADMALRSAQLQGPSQWFMYEVGDVEYEAVKGSLRWRTFLLKMIKKKSFMLFFQPLLSAENNQVIHQEVLCKVKEKEGKYLSAKVFIPMAQKCGLTLEIDLLMVEKACEQLNGLDYQKDIFSLNVSVESLLSVKFRDAFYQILKCYPSVSSRLILEVTEYHLHQHLEALAPILTELNQQKIKILVDKVGQYVVSAHYLKITAIQYIKLHRSLIINLHEKPQNQIFIQSLLKLSVPLGVQVYALGVEHKKEWDMLMRLGVQGGQGHFFAKPLEAPVLAMSSY